MEQPWTTGSTCFCDGGAFGEEHAVSGLTWVAELIGLVEIFLRVRYCEWGNALLLSWQNVFCSGGGLKRSGFFWLPFGLEARPWRCCFQIAGGIWPTCQVPWVSVCMPPLLSCLRVVAWSALCIPWAAWLPLPNHTLIAAASSPGSSPLRSAASWQEKSPPQNAVCNLQYAVKNFISSALGILCLVFTCFSNWTQHFLSYIRLFSIFIMFHFFPSRCISVASISQVFSKGAVHSFDYSKYITVYAVLRNLLFVVYINFMFLMSYKFVFNNELCALLSRFSFTGILMLVFT